MSKEKWPLAYIKHTCYNHFMRLRMRPVYINITNKKLFLRREKFQFFPSFIPSHTYPHQTRRRDITIYLRYTTKFFSNLHRWITHRHTCKTGHMCIIIIILFLNVRWMDIRRRRSCYFPFSYPSIYVKRAKLRILIKSDIHTRMEIYIYRWWFLFFK